MNTVDVVLVYVDPDWCICYVDGMFSGEGHQYMDVDMLKGIEPPIASIETCSVEPDDWLGSPKTLDECMERYG